MTVLGTSDNALNLFGGLVTDMAPADVPAGASPDCADVAFLGGTVMTRPGLLSVFTPIASLGGGGNPTINYLKTFIQPNPTRDAAWRWTQTARWCRANSRPAR